MTLDKIKRSNEYEHIINAIEKALEFEPVQSIHEDTDLDEKIRLGLASDTIIEYLDNEIKNNITYSDKLESLEITAKKVIARLFDYGLLHKANKESLLERLDKAINGRLEIDKAKLFESTFDNIYSYFQYAWQHDSEVQTEVLAEFSERVERYKKLREEEQLDTDYLYHLLDDNNKHIITYLELTEDEKEQGETVYKAWFSDDILENIRLSGGRINTDDYKAFDERLKQLLAKKNRPTTEQRHQIILSSDDYQKIMAVFQKASEELKTKDFFYEIRTYFNSEIVECLLKGDTVELAEIATDTVNKYSQEKHNGFKTAFFNGLARLNQDENKTEEVEISKESLLKLKTLLERVDTTKQDDSPIDF